MPQLQHLRCPTLRLNASEAATLSALTTLSIAGLLPPPPEAGQSGASGTTSASPQPLPPMLRELSLDTAASPRLLAGLMVPPGLAAIRAAKLRIGMSDAAPEGCMSLETVEAMGPALQLLGAMQAVDAEHTHSELSLDWDGGPEPLQPQQGSATGHPEWLVHLRELKGTRSLEWQSFELTIGDLCCLAQALGPDVR